MDRASGRLAVRSGSAVTPHRTLVTTATVERARTATRSQRTAPDRATSLVLSLNLWFSFVSSAVTSVQQTVQRIGIYIYYIVSIFVGCVSSACTGPGSAETHSTMRRPDARNFGRRRAASRDRTSPRDYILAFSSSVGLVSPRLSPLA